MNWHGIRSRLHLFDPTGLSEDTVKILRLMIRCVAFGIVWTNITTGVALTGFLKALGASDTLYGLVFSLPAIANAFQFLCSYLLERTLKPRGMMLLSGMIQRLIWIPIALVPLLIPMGWAQLRLWAVVVMSMISALMGPFMNVSFYTIASDAVPMRIRGRYFATRTRISTLVGLVIGLIVGLLLDRLPGYTGYAVVFTLAGIFGALDISCYLFMPLSPMRATPGRKGLLTMFLGVLRDKEYMRTVIFLTCWVFVTYLTSPYHNVYVKSVLGISNFDIILTGQIASNLMLIFLVTRWGHAIDQYGNRPVLLLSTLLTSLYPLIWTRVGGAGMLVQIFLSNAWSGGTYCAVDLTMQNLFMNQARDENRSMYFAVYFLFTQLLGLALGSMVGGLLLDNVLMAVEPLQITILGASFTRYNALFVLGGAARYVVALMLLTRLREAGSQPVRALLTGEWTAFRVRLHILRAALMRRKLRRQVERERANQDDDTCM